MFVRLKSKEIFERSLEVIPGGVNSPVRAFKGMGLSPLVVERGEGDEIVDVNGDRRIDFCMSWGSLLHGHAHPKIVERVEQQVKKGSSFGAATCEEERLARAVVDGVRNLEQVRFVSSGTEATMSALRLSRGYTGRPFVIKFDGNYHGHSDGLLIEAGSGVIQASSKGVPQDMVKHTLSLPYNDEEALKRLLRDPFYSSLIAAVVVEPIAANMGVVPPSKGFLETVREETKRVGALLIFDEVVTGFRVGYGGAQELFRIEPDLTCLGKIIGGGFPAAAFGGKREIMKNLAPEGEVYQAGTLSGNPVAMVAGHVALEMASEAGFYDELQRKTEMITKPVKEALLKKGLPATVQESVGMFTLFWGPLNVTSFKDMEALDQERFNAYFRFMWERGIYLSPSPYEACFLSSVHTKSHLEQTRDTILDYIKLC